MLASLLGCSFEAMIIDDDMLSGIRRIARGIEVSDDTLSVDAIAEVVNGPGHFLGASQTLERMESEFVYPRHADRSSPDDWADAGSKDIRDRAAIKAREILGSHYPVLIEPEIDARIRERFAIHLGPAWRCGGAGVMTDHVRVAIVGGGIVGCSVLYSLAAHGWTDTVLLERREITSGSTWHAAGNVTYFGHYPGITRLYVNARRPRVSRIVPFRRGTLPVPETQALAASALPGGRDREGRGPS